MGKFIVFEGVDRSGKTTQVRRLRTYLESKGCRVQTLCFPNRTTETGRLIDKYLKGECVLEPHAAHLLFSSNRWESVPELVSALESDTFVICDRYVYSGLVYSIVKPELRRDIEWCSHPDVGLPQPDLVILLHNPVSGASGASNRIGFGREVYETCEIQERVHDAYTRLYAESANTSKTRWMALDMTRSIEEIHTAIALELERI